MFFSINLTNKNEVEIGSITLKLFKIELGKI